MSKVRLLGMAAAVGSTAGGLAVFPGSGVAVAELPSQCVQSQTAVTCAYTDNTGEVSPSGGVHGVPLRIPDGVWKVHIEAVGGRGGDSSCRTVAPGGRGAVARGDAWLVPGSTVYVRVGENGHGGGQPVFGSDGSSPASLAVVPDTAAAQEVPVRRSRGRRRRDRRRGRRWVRRRRRRRRGTDRWHRRGERAAGRRRWRTLPRAVGRHDRTVFAGFGALGRRHLRASLKFVGAAVSQRARCA